MKKIICTVLVAMLCFALGSCVVKTTPQDLWENAMYTENTELGAGEKTITLEVVVKDKTVEFTVHTNKEMLGDALTELKLIEGEQGAYGLYIKKVNGIVADYNSTKSYWSLNKNGEYMTVGVDSEQIAGGEHYEFIYTEQE